MMTSFLAEPLATRSRRESRFHWIRTITDLFLHSRDFRQPSWADMATIKAIDGRSVHQLQSGQVIVDLCSVAKELVENSLDAGASSVEVRFKNHGVDSIEVQDNGSGIAPANYENVALKHYTSKLSRYEDLSSLQSFGFRGEALSSLCALSHFSIITAQAVEAPKGKRLEFDVAGRLKSATMVACQKGTTAVVENLFKSLPVRRKELTKNIKREYGKVLGLLQAYACICVNVKFTVKNAMAKGKSMTVFSTESNATTRENIANVYGAKTLSALVPLELDLDFQPAPTPVGARKDTDNTKILVRGHISKPVFGEGRQTPDRQMFFVNGRPCGLPQIAKAINEVYKSFNVAQSPFIFADFLMDTNAYDVNVSPDKRTILLHNSASLIETLKSSLTEMFDQQDQTVPQSLLRTPRLPAFRPLNVESRGCSASVERPSDASKRSPISEDSDDSGKEASPDRLSRERFRTPATTREMDKQGDSVQSKPQRERQGRAEKNFVERARWDKRDDGADNADLNPRVVEQHRDRSQKAHRERMDEAPTEEPITAITQHRPKDSPGIMPSALDHMRPRRVPAEIATITIGDNTVTTIVGSQLPRRRVDGAEPGFIRGRREFEKRSSPQVQHFSQSLRKFGAPDTYQSGGDSERGHEIEASDEEGSEESVPCATNSSRGLSDGDEELSDGDEEALSDRSKKVLSDRGKEALSDRDEEALSDLRDTHDSDPDDADETEKKAEKARVARLIRSAEESAALPSKENLKRTSKALKGGRPRDSTTTLLTRKSFTISAIKDQMKVLGDTASSHVVGPGQEEENDTTAGQDDEVRLSLTVSKSDFAQMDIVGQFNLGFILAVRPASEERRTRGETSRDELFIIDQHASDEKFHFERLQAETVVGSQRSVRPVILDLTAVEEEIILDNIAALEKNGFLVDIDTSGEKPVGRRCTLVSLPLSKEVVFDTRELDELIHLLAESPVLAHDSSAVPRPTKVRKMFAMRACRSSIMIGKTLSKRQMKTVVVHMGTIDKPWNCPHGRPTMRHLCSLDTIDTWREGDGLCDRQQDDRLGNGDVWKRYTGV